MSGLGGASALPHPGTPPFFPAVLASIRAAAPSLPLDPVVLQALLLCLLAGDKNLILRAREEDVGAVSKLTASTLTSVFGYSTHKLKIRADSKHQTPSEFLRSLFLRSSTPAPGSLSASEELNIASSSSHKHKTTHRRRSGARTPSAGTNLKVQRQLFQRSFSYPAEGPAVPFSATASSSVSKPIDHTTNPNADSDVQRPSLRPPGVHTDPSPLLARHFSLDGLSFPGALVITGLENAGVPAQRALLQVLSDKRAVLDDQDGDWVWNLPEGFIVVYVCVADPRERPPIHKSLLDRFAMSTTITLHPSTQQAIRHTISHHRSQTTPLSNNTSPIPIFPDTLLESLRSLASSSLLATHFQTNIHPTLSLYISDLFSAARHHPQLDGMLLTVRARKDVEALARAGRVIGGDLTGVEFIRAMGKGAEANSEEINPGGEDVEDGDVESLDIRLDGANTDSSAHGTSNSDEAYPKLHETLDVSEADIARIVPRVLSHRLRVRDGPEDEILGGLMHGAVGNCAECQWRDEGDDEKQSASERSTVKDILVKILAEV